MSQRDHEDIKPIIEAGHSCWKSTCPWMMCLLAIAGLYLLSLQNYLLFHTLVEISAVAVAWAVFLLVWSARRLKAPASFVMLGTGYLFVGGLDLLHALAYDGMGVFSHSGPNLATQLWICARYTEAATLLLLPLSLTRGIVARFGAFAVGGAAILAAFSIFSWQSFPLCFDMETGLTPFKKGSEYLLIVLFFAAAVLTWRGRRLIGNGVAPVLASAMLVTAASEFLFTLYATPFSTANMAGHLLKVVSLFLVYRALIVEGIDRPFDIMGSNLREGAMRYSGIIAATTDGFWILDMNGRFLDVNETALKMLGYSREQLLAMTVSDIDTNPAEITRHIEALPSSRNSLFEAVHRRSDGSLLHVEVSCACLYGEVRNIVVFVRDITRRRRAEEHLRFQAAILTQASDALIATDLDLRIISWNPAAERIYGYSEEEALGRHVDKLLQTDWFDVGIEEARAALRNNGVWKGELRQRSKTGKELFIEGAVAWVRDASGAVVGGVTVNRDITERKHLQNLLMEASEREQKHFARELHDGLCQELKSLEFETAMLEDSLAATDQRGAAQAAHIGNKINESVRRAYSIVRRTMLPELDAQGFPSALSGLVRDAAQRLNLIIETNIDDEVFPADAAVASHLYRIAQEALENVARHANPSKAWVCWTANENEGRLVLEVRDNGIGVDQASGKRATGGVGLHIMRSRAAAIGASIVIQRGDDGGTSLRCLVSPVPERTNYTETNG